MYVTAHRVRDDRGNEAIHAFLHEHGDVDWPANVAHWPETYPGRLVEKDTRLPLGGSSVRSYLDVLGPDGTPRSDLRAAVSALRDDLDERVNPTVLLVGKVTLRFGVELALADLRKQELDALGAAVNELLSRSRG